MERERTKDGRIARVPVEERFWTKVDKSGGPDACWPWNGPRRSAGYGYTTEFWKKLLAHRVAYELTFGPIPPGKIVCHSCDNPPCVNPAHLWVGSHTDNRRDMLAKGRQCSTAPKNPRRGEAAGNAKLTEADVLVIRAEYALLGQQRKGRPGRGQPVGSSMAALATRYGVSKSLIHNILTRKAWANV